MKSRVEIEERISRLERALREHALDGSMTFPIALNTELATLNWILGDSSENS